MTKEDKRKSIEAFCADFDGGCITCPLNEIEEICNGKENCYTEEECRPANIDRNYFVLFGEAPEASEVTERTEANPYWERITELAKRQREKGMSKYGQGLEDNPSDIIKRIEHLQEELIDGLMYCEWIKDKLSEGGESIE